MAHPPVKTSGQAWVTTHALQAILVYSQMLNLSSRTGGSTIYFTIDKQPAPYSVTKINVSKIAFSSLGTL
jgi:hypothetical protein